MTEKKYDMYVVFDEKNKSLARKNLLSWGIMDFNKEMAKGDTVNINYTNGDKPLATVIMKVLKVIKRKSVDKLILIDIGHRSAKQRT